MPNNCDQFVHASTSLKIQSWNNVIHRMLLAEQLLHKTYFTHIGASPETDYLFNFFKSWNEH